MCSALRALTVLLACLWLSGCGNRGGMPGAPSKPAHRPASRAEADAEGKWGESAPPETAYAGPARADERRSALERPSPEAAPPRAYAPAKPSEAPSDTSRPAMEERPAESAAPRPGEKPFEPPRTATPADRPAPTRQRAIEPGTLTAGSFDDHERFDDFRSFLSEAVQGDAGEVLPRLAVGQRVLIHVTGAGGRPLGDARVLVRPADDPQDDGPALLETTTGSDGRALFLTGLEGGNAAAYRVSVYAPGSARPVSRVLQAGRQPWRIALDGAAAPLPRRLDLALVIDTTGSMSDELEYLKVEIDSIAAAVHRMFPNVDQRYALVVYRDEGDDYVARTFDFTGSLEEFRAALSRQRAVGGGDYPEAVHVALAGAAKLDWRDRETARVMFLVGDAPPHDRFAGEALEAVRALRARGVRVFPVAASGAKLKAEFTMRAAAFLTLGQYLFLTDHSGVGNPHARPHVPSFQVEHLDRLMVRVIASELAGKRLAPQEVIAIESGASPGDLPVLPEQQTQAPPAADGPGADAPAARASLWPPHWIVLVGALLLVCVVDAMVDRSGAR